MFVECYSFVRYFCLYFICILLNFNILFCVHPLAYFLSKQPVNLKRGISQVLHLKLPHSQATFFFKHVKPSVPLAGYIFVVKNSLCFYKSNCFQTSVLFVVC